MNCACFFDTMSDFNVPKSLPKNIVKFLKWTVRRTYFPPSPRTSDILRDVLIFAFRFSDPSPNNISCGSNLRRPHAVLRRSKMFSLRTASLKALSRIVRAALISRQFGHFAIFLTLLQLASASGKLRLSVSCCALCVWLWH